MVRRRRGGGGCCAMTNSSDHDERKVATAATNTMTDFTQRLPLYTWLPALPLLTARLCHPHAEVRQLIHELLYRLVKNFPNQVLWSMTAMARSTVPDRANAAQRVLDRAKDAAPSSVRPLFDQSAALSDQLIRVCAFQPKALPNARPASAWTSVAASPRRRLCPCAVPVLPEAWRQLTPCFRRNAHRGKRRERAAGAHGGASGRRSRRRWRPIEPCEDEVPGSRRCRNPRSSPSVGSDHLPLSPSCASPRTICGRICA